MQTAHAPATGLLPDFIADPLGSPEPVAPGFLEGANDGAYDYDACRVPWRVATDFLVSGDARAHTVTQRLTTWARASTGNDPALFRSGYQLDGSVSPDADYLSMAFVAPLGVGAMVDAGNQAWLNAIWDLAVAAPIGPLRATVVLGATAGASTAGQCAVSAPLTCTAAGSSIRCR